jgi:hypothetical protein
VNASRIRTARVSTDSPDADLAIYGNYQRGAALSFPGFAAPENGVQEGEN